ncbi:MAG: beta-galactosidase [Clostridiaceae bacterium]|nr:beta-galactosidase [Clostridiaceae bacterium]
MLCGVQFFRYPGPPPEEIGRDLTVFKACGITCVRIQQVWSYEEPRPGQYDFRTLLALLDQAAAAGLDVLITLTLENAPSWLYHEQDICQRNAFGEIIRDTNPYPLPSDGKPGPCWDNPFARAAAERFVEALLQAAAGCPAVKGWVIWQEPTALPRQDPREPGASSYCCCPHTLKKFQAWLQGQYGTLDKLNETLMVHYQDWADLEPPVHQMNPLANAFCNFLRVRMAEIAAWKRALVKKLDPQNRPVMIHAGYSILDRGFGGGWHDDYMLAKNADIYGRSLYPLWFGSENGPEASIRAIHLALDGARGAACGKPVWAAELQGGRACSAFERWPSPTGRDLVNWTLASVAGGAKGLIYWQYREERIFHEAYGHGLLNRRGEAMPWLADLAVVLRFLHRHEPVFDAAVPESATIAIVVNTDNYILGYQAARENWVADSLPGLYQALHDLDLPVDLVWADTVLQSGLAGYKFVFLPFPAAMAADYARVLADYVSGGGTIISEAGAALFDEHSIATIESPAFGLDRVFGGCEDDLFDLRHEAEAGQTGEKKPVTEQSFDLEGCGVMAGLSVPGRHWLQTYRIQTGCPVFRWRGRAAGLVNHYGRGKAYLIGTFFSQSEPGLKIVERILQTEGLITAAAEREQVRLRRLTGPAGDVLILYNPGSAAACRSVPRRRSQMLSAVFQADISEKKGVWAVEVAAYSSACLIISQNESVFGTPPDN